MPSETASTRVHTQKLSVTILLPSHTHTVAHTHVLFYDNNYGILKAYFPEPSSMWRA